MNEINLNDKMFDFPDKGINKALEIVMQYNFNQITTQEKSEVEILLDHCLIDISENSNKFLTTLMIKAIKNHIGPISIDEHIYLKKFELPQIKLFDLIIKHFPFVNLSHYITNSILKNSIIKSHNPVLIDIGIGRGIQILSLINELKKYKNSKINKLTIIGIEPIQDAIEIAKQTILQESNKLNFVIEFIPINDFVENINYNILKTLIPSNCDNLIANASLTLHHVQSSEERNRFISDLNKLKPTIFLLTEPNVNHFEPNFYKRFQNCYNHFYHIFNVIDKQNISIDEKSALKLFFGREIEDIIGKKENDRYERHEKASTWIQRLKKAGFSIKSGFEIPEIKHTNSISLNHTSSGYLGFKHANENILSIIMAHS